MTHKKPLLQNYFVKGTDQLTCVIKSSITPGLSILISNVSVRNKCDTIKMYLKKKIIIQNKTKQHKALSF